MRNIENNIEKLTATASKSYHGNMENGEKNLPMDINKEQIKNKPPFLGKEAGNSQKNIVEKAGVKQLDRTPEQSISDAQRRMVLLDKIGGKDDEKEEKKGGILSLFLDFLTSVFHDVDVSDLEKKLENSEAMRGVQAYDRIMPRNKWGARDYARVVSILTPDTTPEASIIVRRLREEVAEKKMEAGFYKKWAEIERSSFEQPRERVGGGPERNGKIWNKAVLAHADLWEEMKESGELSGLSPEDRFFFAGVAGKISGGAGHKENDNKSNESEENSSQDRVSREEWLRMVAKNTERIPEIADTAKNMLKELKDINNNLKKFVDDYVSTIIDDPEEFARNPGKFKKMQHAYITQRTRESELESQLEEMSRGEKRVLGGEKDKDLYAGNIDQVLDERMKRIEYFVARKQYSANGEIDFGKLGEDSVLNPNASKIKDEEKAERQEFLKRMKKRCIEFEDEGVLVKHEGLYFQEMQRWVGNIMENSIYGKGQLKMPKDIYDEFKKIKDMNPYLNERENEDAFEHRLLGAVKTLRKEKFLDYFKGVSYLNLEGKDVDPSSGEIGHGSYGYPSCLEATMLLIANDRGAEWRTGNEHELIDASGKFHQENFILWMRKEMNKLTDWDPWSPIDPMRGITFKAGFSQISLFDILYLPQYTQHQEIEMAGDVVNWYKEGKEKEASFSIGWGEKKDHPDMTYDTRVNRILIDEPWLAGIEHNDWVTLNNIQARGSIDEWLKAKQQIANSNNYTRSGLWTRSLMLPSHDGHEGKDTENYLKKKKQGTMGEAVNAGRLFYRYLTEFTEFHMEKKDGKALKVREDNMAYKALDRDGASVFLTSIAESALEMADSGARTKIKGAYKDFILGRVDEMKEIYRLKKQDGKSVDMEKVDQLVKIYKDKIRDIKPDDMKISFDTFDKLVELQMKMETVAMGKTKVTENEKKDFNLSADKVVVEREVGDDVKALMRKCMYKNDGEGFLNKVMKIEVPKTQEPSEGEAKKIEEGKGLEIGKIEVLMDDNGRIVKREEWMQMGEKKENIKTMEQILKEDMGENGNSFVGDWKDLEVYEEKFGTALKEYDQAVKDKSSDLDAKEQAYKEIKNKYDGILKRREGLGLAMLTKVANIERKNLNFWNTTRPMEESGRKIIKDALMKSLGAIYGLDKEEQMYAHDRIWYPLDHMEIAGFNNTSGVPGAIEQSTYSRTMEMRNAAMGLGTMGGGDETLEEILALRLPSLFERVKVKKRGEGMTGGRPEHMMIEILQGGKGRELEPRWKRKLADNPDELFEIGKNWEHADFIDGLSKAENARKVIVEEDPELGSFHEIVKLDAWGVMKVDHAKARKIFNAWWNNVRLIYNSHQINYDDKIAVDGREVSIREHMFGKKTRKTQERMRDFYKELEGKGGKDADLYKKMAEDIMNKPALAAMMDMVTAGIHEHMTFGTSYDMWSTQNVVEIWTLLDQYFHQPGIIDWGKEGGVELEKMPSMMPYKLFDKLLEVQEDDSMEWFMFMDLLKAFTTGMLKGVFEFMDESGDEIVQVKKIYKGG